MGHIFCIIGKSSSGKDTIYKRLLDDASLHLLPIIIGTTRPMRDWESQGDPYYFYSVDDFFNMERDGLIVEHRRYDTTAGPWYYFTMVRPDIDPKARDYLIVNTLDAYLGLRDYYGSDIVVPIYVYVDDGARLRRAVNRESKQSVPDYEEVCRRFIADNRDFSGDRLSMCGVSTMFENDNLEDVVYLISEYIRDFKYKSG